jgi:hypothetical protein
MILSISGGYLAADRPGENRETKEKNMKGKI